MFRKLRRQFLRGAVFIFRLRNLVPILKRIMARNAEPDGFQSLEFQWVRSFYTRQVTLQSTLNVRQQR